jgi:RimJ/RimL family protein N-acetyltransferase
MLSLAAVHPRHIEAIRQWRNAQMDLLRQSRAIAPQEQVEYFEHRIWPDKARAEPANILLIIEDDGEPIGYGGLVHIAWEHRRAEISFLVKPEIAADLVAYRRCFLGFLGLAERIAFGQLGLHRLFTETYAIRTDHMAVIEEAGFRREGVMRHHVRIGGRPVDSVLHGRVNERNDF